LREGALREAEDLRGGERPRPAAAGARLAGVDHLMQRLVMRNSQDLGRDLDRLRPHPGRAGDERPPGEQMLPRRPWVGVRPAQVERVA